MKKVYWKNMSRLFWSINIISKWIILCLILFNKFDKAKDRPNIRDVESTTIFITNVLRLFGPSNDELSGSSFSIESAAIVQFSPW